MEDQTATNRSVDIEGRGCKAVSGNCCHVPGLPGLDHGASDRHGPPGDLARGPGHRREEWGPVGHTPGARGRGHGDPHHPLDEGGIGRGKGRQRGGGSPCLHQSVHVPSPWRSAAQRVERVALGGEGREPGADARGPARPADAQAQTHGTPVHVPPFHQAWRRVRRSQHPPAVCGAPPGLPASHRRLTSRRRGGRARRPLERCRGQARRDATHEPSGARGAARPPHASGRVPHVRSSLPWRGAEAPNTLGAPADPWSALQRSVTRRPSPVAPRRACATVAPRTTQPLTPWGRPPTPRRVSCRHARPSRPAGRTPAPGQRDGLPPQALPRLRSWPPRACSGSQDASAARPGQRAPAV